jgi:uncharacterized protein YecT (DUF1311 family)
MWQLRPSERDPFGKAATAGPHGCECTTVVLMTLLSLVFRADGLANETLIPPDWQPSLSALEVRCKAELEPKQGHTLSQQELNDISSRLAEVYDAELFVTYVQLLETLDTKQRRELFREQQRWLRDRATKAAGQVQSKGGSLAALEYSGAFCDFTEKRIAELRGRMPPGATKPQ